MALASFVALFVGCTFLPQRRTLNTSAFTVAVGAAVLSAGGVYLAWLASPLEIPRHAIPFTVIIPLMLVFGSLLLVDAAIGPHRVESRHPPAHGREASGDLLSLNSDGAVRHPVCKEPGG